MGGLLDFDRRTVVVTGAASGIGAAAVNGFVTAGADVHAVDIVPIADATSAGGVGEHRCDLGDEAPALMLLADDAASSFVHGVYLVVDGGIGAAERRPTDDTQRGERGVAVVEHSVGGQY